MINRALILAATLSVASQPLSAQTVKAPSATNQPAGHAILTGANAVQLAPKAHEIPAAGVGSETPAARPFASGVTAAGNDVSVGMRQSSNVASKNGVSVNPAAGANAAPVATPTVRGATNGAAAVSTGAQTTVASVAKHGPQLNPTGAISPSARTYETRAAGSVSNQAKRTAKSAADPRCDEQSYQANEC